MAAAASVRLSLAGMAGTTTKSGNKNTTPLGSTITTPVMETPRNLPMATPRIIQQPPKPTMGGKRAAAAATAGATVTGEVQYSMQKRPKTAPPKNDHEAIKEQIEDAMKLEGTGIDVTHASG